jgi:acyl-CoA synthetase (AMP-forming)/AMP-acid ligase II
VTATSTLIHHYLERAADRLPDKPAVCHHGVWTTYGALEAAANRLAAHLRRAGVERGDRVALLLENSAVYISSQMAVFKAGAISVALNNETTAETLNYLLNDAGARVLIIAQKYLRHLVAIREPATALSHVIVDGDVQSGGIDRFATITLREACVGSGESRIPCPTIDVDAACIAYTSGSTGRPRGVMLSHLNLVSSTRSTVSYLDLKEDDRVMVVLPFHYIYGASLLYTHLAVAGSIVLKNRSVYPNVVLDAMDQHRVTGFAGVPSTFMLLLNKSTLRNRKFESLRYVTQAGGAMAVAFQRQVAEAFHPAKFFVMYGATEAGPRMTYLDPAALPHKWGSIGKAVPNVEVFVADAEGRRVPRGTIGEIVARGSNIMSGYWRDPEGTASVLRNGLYYTGDLGREDDEGFLYIEGRAKDMIKVGGNRIGAQEIEDCILKIDAVAEVAVIGVEDEFLGEAVNAFVVLKEHHSLSETELKGRLQQLLPPFKMPKRITFRSDLPKNEAGKVLKIKLKEAAADCPEPARLL